MQPDDISYIDRIVEAYRGKLLEVGHLKRTNRQQRTKLSEAHSLILNLPALLRERERVKERTQ